MEQCFKPSTLAEVPQNLVKLRQGTSCYEGFHKKISKKTFGKTYNDFLKANHNTKQRKQDLLTTHYNLGNCSD